MQAPDEGAARQLEGKDQFESDRKRQKLCQDAGEQEVDRSQEVWAKLSSITTQTTRSIPSHMLRIKGTEFKIGRNDMNDLQILNPLVSGHHATIIRSECAETGMMVIKVADSSSNGTFINGKLVSDCNLTGNLDR